MMGGHARPVAGRRPTTPGQLPFRRPCAGVALGDKSVAPVAMCHSVQGLGLYEWR
jgi:hypothetical protein